MGDTKELVEWLAQHNLLRVKDALLDEEHLGLVSVEDLKILRDEDVQDICAMSKMNIGERNRFIVEVRRLREGKPVQTARAKEDAIQVPAPDTNKQGEEDEADWFEVVNKSMVVVKCAPSPQARDLGCLWLGESIQVKKKQAMAADGHAWVELTPSQMLLSCDKAVDPESRGYALIDGTYIGLCPLLRKLERGAKGDKSKHEEHSATPGALGGEQSARSFRPSPFRPAGADPPQSVDDAELERQHARCAADAATLRRGRLRIRRAFSPKAPVKVTEAVGSEEDLQAPSGAEAEENEARHEVLRELHSRAEWLQRQEEALRKSSVVYRAVHDVLCFLPPGDPSQGSKQPRPCVPGAAVYCTGKQWTDPQGAIWFERQGLGSRVCDWVLLQEPLSEDRPFLVREEELPNRARVEVKYLADALSFRIFETCLSAELKVHTLRSRLCSETGLKPDSTVLLPRLGGGLTRQSACHLLLQASESEAGLQDEHSLAEYALLGEVQLYLVYTSDFEADFEGGRWSVKRKR